MGLRLPPRAPRGLLLLVAGLIVGAIEYAYCQRTLNIGQDPSSCQMTPSGWNSTIRAGSNIRATCNRACTGRAVETNQNSRKRTVRGTGIYSLDSDVCLAAIHDARLAYPSHWVRDTAPVQLTVRRHLGAFVGSFRRGIITPRPRTVSTERVQLGLVFVSGKVTETVPQITMIYNNFRFEKKSQTSAIQCHPPMGLNLSESKLFRPTGFEYGKQETTNHESEDRGNFKEVVIKSGTKVLCSIQDSLYSDTTAFGFITNPYFEPNRLVYRASEGDRLEVRFRNTAQKLPSWFKDGSDASESMKVEKLDRYIFESARQRDSGLYELKLEGGVNEGASLVSIIVRGCPADRFGERCEHRCPYCLHGGQCHDVTGQCVCAPGFHGDRCQTSCGRGRFGAGCSARCSGDGGDCKDQLLCVPKPYGCGCAPGYYGSFCNQRCNRGSYGPHCVSSCGRCRDGSTCDRITGQCENGCEDGFYPPLCLDLPPWFRDPPALVFVRFTTLRITHTLWSDDYDNGYGTGRYNYTVEYRRTGSQARWHRGPTEFGSPPTGNVTLDLAELRVDTKYLVRIVIGDLSRRTSTTDEAKVPAINVTTNCQKPSQVADIAVRRVTSRSAEVIIQSIRNEKTACSYTLKWTLRAASTEDKTDEVAPGSDGSTSVLLSNLRPHTNYTLQVVAGNRKGEGAPSTKTFKTDEAAPSNVEDLTVTKLPDSELEHIFTWKAPAQKNGVIRLYMVKVQHRRYLACPDRRGFQEEEYVNVTDTFFQLVVKHPFSTYSILVTAFTVSPGPTVNQDFVTEAQAPSAGLTNVRALAKRETTTDISWQLPACTEWNDNYQSIRIYLNVTGTSPWNRNKLYRDFENQRRNQLTVINLTPYSNYTALLKLNNSVGFSSQYSEVKFVTTQSRNGPGRPVSLTVLTVSSTSLTVGWNPPSPPFCRITEYRVRCRGHGCYRLPLPIVTESRHCRPVSSPGRQCSAEVTGLREVTYYTVTVTAYCPDVGRAGYEADVVGKTQEGKPSPPVDVNQEGRELTQLNVSWAAPVQRNGIILSYQLNISESEASTPLQSHVIETSKDTPEDRYHHLVTDLEPGRRYLVRLAASTSAGQGDITTVWLETRVPKPSVPAPPEVRTDQITDTTVQVHLPSAASPGGPPVTRYYVIVSEDPDLDGGEVEGYREAELPTAEEASNRGISFYVAAVADPDHVDQNGTFVIGDGKYYNASGKSFYNRPLKTGHTYRIGMAALSKISEGNQALSFKAVEDLITVQAPKGAVGTIVGVLSGVMLIMLIGIGLVAFRRHLLAKKAGMNTATGMSGHHALQTMDSGAEEMYDPGPQEDTYANLTPVFLNKTRIPLSELAAATRNTEALHQQINSLQSGLVRPCAYGRLVQNRGKNRYGNLMPYDDTRVKLEKLPDDEFSDYINASYVDGYERPGAYIATQGPKPQTIFDFWRMVWEKRAARIVMLTNLVEGDKKKCDLYWPEEKPLEMLNLTVRKDSERVSNDYTVRRFSMARDGERRRVTHLHYTVWPDHSVPLYPSSLAKFIRELDAVPDGGGPTVVHCSAGVGRTGTVILIDAMHKMGRCEQAVDVYRQLTIIRQQRANLCANLAQYQLVHQVLAELLVAPSTAVPAAQLAARLPALKSVADGPSELERQLSYLASNPPPASFASARAEQLEGKNRSPEILPEDRSRVFIHGNLRDNYVNAVYVQGFKKPDAFIATEAPLPTRRGLFWQMVVQKRSQTIVVMNDLAPEDVFWPTTEEPVIYGNIAAQLKNRISDPVQTLDVTLNVFTNGQMESSQEVRLFLLPIDPAAGGLPPADDIVSLHAAYERSMPHNFGGVTTVVCRTGVTGCGLFVACSFVLHQLAEEQEVDVVMAVSAVRKSRPQFVATLKQFELCYDVAVAWLKAFDIYSNFQ